MLTEIKYPNLVSAVGRNGYMHQSGIEVLFNEQTGMVTLTPLTSKGVTGNAYMEIPYESLGDVRRAITEAYMTFKGTQAMQEQVKRMHDLDVAFKAMGTTPIPLSLQSWNEDKFAAMQAVAIRTKVALGNSMRFESFSDLVEKEWPDLFDGPTVYEMWELLPFVHDPKNSAW